MRSSFGYESSYAYRGSVSIRDFCWGECSYYRRFYVYFSFLSIIDTLFMYLWSCDYFVIANLVLVDIYTFEVVITVISPISPCVVSFLYTHVSYFLYAIYYFCFTLRCCDEFCFKVFQKYKLSKSTCPKLSSCKVFQEFVLG